MHMMHHSNLYSYDIKQNEMVLHATRYYTLLYFVREIDRLPLDSKGPVRGSFDVVEQTIVGKLRQHDAHVVSL